MSPLTRSKIATIALKARPAIVPARFINLRLLGVIKTRFGLYRFVPLGVIGSSVPNALSLVRIVIAPRSASHLFEMIGAPTFAPFSFFGFVLLLPTFIVGRICVCVRQSPTALIRFVTQFALAVFVAASLGDWMPIATSRRNRQEFYVLLSSNKFWPRLGAASHLPRGAPVIEHEPMRPHE